MSLAFMTEAQDLAFHGRTGRGKTHLAIAIGLECVERGMEARFFTTTELLIVPTRAGGGIDRGRYSPNCPRQIC